MKVLQILPELNSGGVERGTLEIGEYLVQHGQEAVVVSNGGRLVSALEKAGIRHLTLPVHRKSLSSLLQVRPLRRLLAKEQPDILHVRSRVPAWIAWLAWRREPEANRPHLISTVHGFYSVNPYSAIMVRSERVIAVSESIREHVLRNYPATQPSSIRVIPRGIEPGDYPRGFRPPANWLQQWDAEYPQLKNRKLLTLPGRITRLKGHEDFFNLIAALAKRDETVHGLVVGDAHPRKKAYFEELRMTARQMGVSDRITFTGHRTDLREIMAISTVVYSLSQQPEAFGRTALEAMALGRPVVAYDHGGVGELLRAHYPAGAVPPGDFAKLVDVSHRAMSQPGTPAAISAPYTLAAMCAATLETYEELVHESRVRERQ